MIIKTALKFLVGEVNEFIALKVGADTTRVELNGLVNQEGTIMIGVDKVGCTLVNIEEERTVRTQVSYGPPVNGNSNRINPPVKLNLYVLFAANPKVETTGTNYEEGLALISYIVSFFQSKNHFDTENSPSLDPSIGKLLVELYSLPVEQQNYLWGSVGAKYMPSVLYRVRMLEVQENNVLDSSEAISEIAGQGLSDGSVTHKY